MWYIIETSPPTTQAARMLIRITRMLSTNSELSFPIKAAMRMRFSTMVKKTASSRTPSATVIPIIAASLSKALAETLSILRNTEQLTDVSDAVSGWCLMWTDHEIYNTKP